MSVASRVPTLEEMVGRADSLVPVLRERAAQTEQLRHVPRATIEDVHAIANHIGNNWDVQAIPYAREMLGLPIPIPIR